MPWYVKISYPSNGCNQALYKSIAYIGKYFCNYTGDSYKDGVTYLSKKVRGASKRAVRLMVEQKKIKNSEVSRQWCFRYRVYRRLYRRILNCLTEPKCGNNDEAKEIIHSLYIELLQQKKGIERTISNVMVRNEKNVLNYASITNKEKYAIYQEEITAIKETFVECDKIYSKLL